MDLAQEEVRKAKIAANEEKSGKIFTERKVKDLTRRIQELDQEMAQVRKRTNVSAQYS